MILINQTTNNLRGTSHGEVYDNLKHSILEFNLKPGEKIREDVISKKLKCSRTPVREAIIRLEHDGLLEKIPHQGVFVKKYSLKEIMEINVIQNLLEIPTAMMAMENRTEDDLNLLQKNLDSCDRFLLEGDLANYTIQSIRFHQIIYEASKNTALAGILQNLREKLIIKSRISFMNPERCRRNLEEHREIYGYLEKKERTQLEELIRRHKAESQENFLQMIRERPDLVYVSI